MSAAPSSPWPKPVAGNIAVEALVAAAADEATPVAMMKSVAVGEPWEQVLRKQSLRRGSK